MHLKDHLSSLIIEIKLKYSSRKKLRDSVICKQYNLLVSLTEILLWNAQMTRFLMPEISVFWHIFKIER